MSVKQLSDLEADVVRARAKLGANLAVMRSQSAYTELKESLEEDLEDVKTELRVKALDSARSTMTTLTTALKEKAAQNPAAVLAIAAGVGWRLFKSPPIASTLVGLGLYSLLKSPAIPSADLAATARRRASEQAAAAAELVKSSATSAGARVMDTATDLKEKAQQATDDILAGARRHWHDAQDELTEMGESVVAYARTPAPKSETKRESWNGRSDVRDTALLAAAGVAVAASLGLAWQRRETAK